jgi:hypothetical protein
MKKYIYKKTISIFEGLAKFFNDLVKALEDAAFENAVKKQNKNK